jgi:LisH domain-containing protein ARMC9
MNLSLRSNGKDKCEDPEIGLLSVLNDLVEHEDLQVRTYVNGTLYSIFTRKKLREEAKEIGMPEVLQYLMS